MSRFLAIVGVKDTACLVMTETETGLAFFSEAERP